MYRRNGNTVSFQDYVERIDKAAMEREERFDRASKEREDWFKSWLEKFDLDRKETAERLEKERKAAEEKLEKDRLAAEGRQQATEARLMEERKEARREYNSQKFWLIANFIVLFLGLSGIFIAILLAISNGSFAG